MIVMSDDFNKSISATEREMKGYVEVSFVSSADKSEFTIDNEPEILQINNVDIPDAGLLDDDRKGKNYASLEQDYFLLDGTFVLPNNDATKNPGMGYVSKYTFGQQQQEISEVNPFHFETDATGCSGITVYFQNNVPTDLEFRVMSGGSIETFTDIDITDTGIASVTFSERDVTDLYVVVNDMLYTNRRLRIQEIDFGLSQIYEGEDLISFKTIEQCDRFADTMPINECEVVLGDYEGKFDVNNPKGITQYLGENVLIKPFVGVVTEDNGIEYCILGTYWLDEWKNDKSSATLIAKDIFTKMDKANYWLTTDNNITYNNYLSKKSQDWGITINNKITDSNDYIIKQYSDGNTAVVWVKHFQPDTYLENLQKYCITFGNTITSARNGELNYISSKNNIVSNIINKELLQEYSEIKDKKKIKDINVSEYNYSATGISSSTNEVAFEKVFELNGITEIKAPLGNFNWAHVYMSDNPTIIEKNIDTTSLEGYKLAGWSSQLYLKLNYTGNLTIRVDFPANLIQLGEYINTYNMNETGDTIDIKDDFLTGAKFFASGNGTRLQQHSQAIINYRIANMSNKELSCKFNGNPTIECGDCIEVENKYSTEEEPLYDKVWVTKIESEFKGSFNQIIEGDILEN